LLETGDAAGAEAELRRALSLNHPREVVVPPLARAMLAQREVKKVIKEFASEKLASPSAQGDLQLSLATAYGADGQPALAEAAMGTALAVAPEYPPAMLERARRMAMQGDDDGALKQLDAVIAQVPDN
jgi:predicted Zn-dependent protease